MSGLVPWGLGWIPMGRGSRVRGVLVDALMQGAVPNHVAFIMDGNRRFARRAAQEPQFGHTMGFHKLEEALEWCLDIGVRVVTVYAFSIENFKRSDDEVNALMELAKDKLVKLMKESDMIKKHEVGIRILGEVTLLPLDVQKAMGEAVTLSKGNKKAILNVCLPYTSRHEMADVAKSLAKGCEDGELELDDIDEDLMQRCLYTRDCGEPDLLIRTSGEVRLSDFLLWQTSYSCLHFTKVLWPEFTLFDMFIAILDYQRNEKDISDYRNGKQRRSKAASVDMTNRERRQDQFVNRLYQRRDDYYLSLS